jgi:hypothetical protein
VAVTEDGVFDRSKGSRRRRSSFVVVVVLVLLVVTCLGATGAVAAKGGGKLTACVTKKGPHKGEARFVRGGKCKRGERKLTWNKRGQPGKAGERGQPGPTGATGPAGAGGSTDQLLTLIQQQQAAIDALTQRVSALCTQVSTVTSQSDVLRTVISGLSLDGVIPIGLLLDIPTLPAPLGAFGCPS